MTDKKIKCETCIHHRDIFWLPDRALSVCPTSKRAVTTIHEIGWMPRHEVESCSAYSEFSMEVTINPTRKSPIRVIRIKK